MPFRHRPDGRRRTFLSLAADIDRGLRAAFAKRAVERGETQTSLAEKLDINRSVVHRRLTSKANLTLESIADLVWALGYAIRVEIYDPQADHSARRNQTPIPLNEGGMVPLAGPPVNVPSMPKSFAIATS